MALKKVFNMDPKKGVHLAVALHIAFLFSLLIYALVALTPGHGCVKGGMFDCLKYLELEIQERTGPISMFDRLFMAIIRNSAGIFAGQVVFFLVECVLVGITILGLRKGQRNYILPLFTFQFLTLLLLIAAFVALLMNAEVMATPLLIVTANLMVRYTLLSSLICCYSWMSTMEQTESEITKQNPVAESAGGTVSDVGWPVTKLTLMASQVAIVLGVFVAVMLWKVDFEPEDSLTKGTLAKQKRAYRLQGQVWQRGRIFMGLFVLVIAMGSALISMIGIFLKAPSYLFVSKHGMAAAAVGSFGSLLLTSFVFIGGGIHPGILVLYVLVSILGMGLLILLLVLTDFSYHYLLFTHNT